jgi:hypothetical protein
MIGVVLFFALFLLSFVEGKIPHPVQVVEVVEVGVEAHH